MPEYKFTYFNYKGYAEPVRFMLSYMGKEFEDVRVTKEEWPQLKEKTPFGKIPTLEFDGRILHQSLAIVRYFAQQAGLAGVNAEENLEIEMIAGAFGDLASEICRCAKTENIEEKEKLKKSIINEAIPFFISRLETILKNNGGYLANGKLSWAEFFVVGFNASIPGIIGVDLTEKYPFFKDLVERVHSLPGIKEWVAKRPESVF